MGGGFCGDFGYTLGVLKQNDMLKQLPNVEECFIPEEKLTKYALDLTNTNGGER